MWRHGREMILGPGARATLESENFADITAVQLYGIKKESQSVQVTRLALTNININLSYV